MNTDVMARVYALVASLALAVVATLGVALSMTGTGDKVWTEARVKAAGTIAVAKREAPAASQPEAPAASKQETPVAKAPSAQSLSAWKAPATATMKQVL